jgi:hypothetical protein
MCASTSAAVSSFNPFPSKEKTFKLIAMIVGWSRGGAMKEELWYAMAFRKNRSFTQIYQDVEGSSAGGKVNRAKVNSAGTEKPLVH